MSVPPVVILGLGVSGLGCGRELTRRNIPFLAFEKEDRAGGLAKTDGANGFLFDHGPHILLGDKAELDTLFAGLDGLDLTAKTARSGIALDGGLECVVPAPFQRNLNRLPLRNRVRILADMLFARRDRPPANYADYAMDRCGRGVYELFLRGYESKRLRFPLDQIPADWTKRIEKTSLRSLLFPQPNHSREDKFLYPRDGGIESLPKAMARALPEGSAKYGYEAIEIRAEEKLVVFANGDSVRYGYLVPSLPLPEIVAALRNPPPEVRRAARNLLFTSIYVVNIGIDRIAPAWSILRIPTAGVGFYRVSFPSQYSAQCAPEGYSAVTGEISHHPERYPMSCAEAKQQFRAGLDHLGILKSGQPTAFESIRNIRCGHVIYNRATQASVRLILDYLNSRNVYPCGKYGLWQDMLIPQSIRTGMHVAEQITPGGC